MFQFRRFPTYAYLIQRRLTEYCSAGFPHSVIHGSMRMCRSPWLIAACHDLLRLLMPRHSPCALSSLTSSAQSPLAPFPAIAYAIAEKLRSLPCASSRSRTRFAGLRSRKRSRSRARARKRAALCTLWFSSTVKNYAGIQREVPLAHCFTLSSFHNLLWILCCLLHISGMFLHCSVFKVQLLTH